MNSHFYHIQININFQNLAYYKSLMEFMGWSVIFETDDVCGYKSGTTGDLWFVKTDHNQTSEYDAKGVNHLALRVEKMTDVDEVKSHVENRGTQMLFDTPRHRPEFASTNDETYYQIMFESPDKVLFEVVFIGSKRTK